MADIEADAVIAFFAGDPNTMAARYREGVNRYRGQDGAVAPLAAHLLRGDDGITVVLLWADPPGHEPFGRHMQSVIGELGLPFPVVRHLKVLASSWAVIAGLEQATPAC